ncbi:PREDICTED: uncharacterized protein LOC105561415 [Vollenhovia emeryi]|uniref:uncharacterized protein LOC105561415 n=1 Tax=Vollenhovia emeryi TaxID=411798 RepID=UPI0005F510A8|nr:PREDICTED: uncharacterized protein LOC105561415 [Vollenhovia emeryi]
MSERIKLLVQKRTSLKSQITNLGNLLDKGKIDNAALKLRIARLTDLYHAFEEHNDELMILEPDEGHRNEFAQVQQRFYDLAGKAENILNPVNIPNADTGTTDDELRTGTSGDEPRIGTTSDEPRIDNGSNIAPVKKRRIKLPDAPLPTFNGKYENWLSFKNAFSNMIGSQTDLSDVDKLHYLKSALIEEAANKVKIFAVNGINYSNAWELLERSYEVKRVLVSRHLSLILNTPTLDKETTSGLSKLADDTQQHIASLSALGVSVGSEMIVHILESKLPKTTLERWEASLERDEFPNLEQMYEFLYKAAVCASRRERIKIADNERGKGEPPVKRKRYSANQAFVLNSSRNCVACKTKRHPLYLCDKFKQLSVPKRIELVKNAKICYNCLRSHRDSPYKFSSCTICQKRHNTLLHYDKYANAGKPDASKPATVTAA